MPSTPSLFACPQPSPQRNYPGWIAHGHLFSLSSLLFFSHYNVLGYGWLCFLPCAQRIITIHGGGLIMMIKFSLNKAEPKKGGRCGVREIKKTWIRLHYHTKYYILCSIQKEGSDHWWSLSESKESSGRKDPTKNERREAIRRSLSKSTQRNL